MRDPLLAAQFGAALIGATLPEGPASPRTPLGQLLILQWELEHLGVSKEVMDTVLFRALTLSHVAREHASKCPG